MSIPQYPLQYFGAALSVGLLVQLVLFPRMAHSEGNSDRKSFSVADRLRQYGDQARARLAPYFQKAAVAYPPKEIVLVALKRENELQVYARGAASAAPVFIQRYPILAASGSLGPKLREGDLQVPEGLYRIELLNPNSRFHLSLRVNYPNEFDREHARKEGRTRLGGDIMIHGNSVSIGCIAIGDVAIEELFTLVAEAGLEHTRVIIAPADFRVGELASGAVAAAPAWLDELYHSIKRELMTLPVPG